MKPILCLFAVLSLLGLKAQSSADFSHDPNYTIKAQQVLTEITSGQFEKVEVIYSAKVAAGLPPGKLAAVWKQLQTQNGPFEKSSDLRNKRVGEFQTVTITCVFKSTRLDLHLAFNREDQLAGIRFVPIPTNKISNWQPPSYAKTSFFTEQPITVTFAHWQLPGTLTLPNGAGPFPAIVLVHGSGPHDQDESIEDNKPFKDLAWGLASRGIAVLRYTKRTQQYSAENSTQLTIDDEVINDAHAAIALLAGQPKIDPTRVYLAGHSLGAYLAPRIA